MLDKLYRQTLLGIADNSAVKSFATTQGWKLGVKRFVAGENLEEALPALREIEAEGKYPILDLLGEFVDTEAGAADMTEKILGTLERLEQTSLNRYMSVKPTQLGLGISFDLGLENAKRILDRAKAMDAKICFDMENYPYVEDTLKLYKTLASSGYDNVSTVLQSYLRRTMDDLKDLLELEPKPSLRIVKGAYKESDEVAFQDKAKVDAHFKDLVCMGLENGAHINVATHDEAIIAEIKDFIRSKAISKEQYEFQLLYGVKPKLQQSLLDEGHLVRIYVPYGEDWYGYFSRRLAERPANLMFVVRGMLG